MSKYPNTLGRIEGVWNKLGGEAGVDAFLRGETEIVRVEMLELVGTMIVPATTVPFNFTDNFESFKKTGLSGCSAEFESRFLKDNKIEEPIDEQELCCAKLRRPTSHRLIVSELGGEEKAETTLTEIFHLMTLEQKDTVESFLLTDGTVYVFYVRDTTGILCEFFVYWRNNREDREECNFWVNGWEIHATPITAHGIEDNLIGRLRVVCRNR